jgi:PAS domain S-box-containing protein
MSILEKFQAIFEQAAIGIGYTSLEGQLLETNQKFADMIGYERQELLAKRFQDITHPDDVELNLDYRRSLFSGQIDSFAMEKRYIRKDGSILWTNLTASLIRDRDGNPQHTIAIVEDISDRKQAEEFQKRQVEREKLLNHITNSIRSSLNLDTTFTTAVNEIGELLQVNRISIYQYLPELRVWKQVNGYRKSSDLPDDTALEIPDENNDLAAQLKQRKIVRLDSSDDVPDQTNQVIAQVFPGAWLIIPLHFGGSVWGALSLIEAQQPYHWSDDQVQLVSAIADQLAIAIQHAELHQQLFLKNQALIETKGLAEAATRTQRDFLAMMSHEIRTPLNGLIGMTEVLLETGLSLEQRNFVDVIQVSGNALMTVINDILDFSKIESDKLELERSPFNLEECLKSAITLLSSRASERGVKLGYHIHPQTPVDIIGDTTWLRQILMNLTGNAIKFTPSGEIVILVSSRELVGESADPLATISSTHELLFSVTDSGIGIPADRLELLFKPFSQADVSTTRNYGGTGLGLAISKRLSLMMGGSMWVESNDHTGGEPPPLWKSQAQYQAQWHLEKSTDLLSHNGSTFYFTILTSEVCTINRNEAKDTNRQESIFPVIPTDRDLAIAEKLPLRILLAEDNIVNQKIIQAMLRKTGYQSDLANNGLEVISALQSKIYDVILMDIMMPEMDGIAASKLIRVMEKRGELSARSTTPIRIIALTASAMLGDRERCLNAGMDDYLTKPLRLDDLVKAFSRFQLHPQELATEISQTSGTLPNGQLTAASDRQKEISIDPKALQNLRKNVGADSAEFLHEMIDTYLIDAPQKLQIIESAIAAGSNAELRMAAHSLKSSSAIFGATLLSQICRELEIASVQENANIDILSWQKLTAEFERVKTVLLVERQKS